MGFESFVEEVHVVGRDLVDKVRDLIHEGNVQRIVVKDEHGNTFVEIPITVAAVGAILAPLLAPSAQSLRWLRSSPSWLSAASRSPQKAASPFLDTRHIRQSGDIASS